jgi:hypothetical protein
MPRLTISPIPGKAPIFFKYPPPFVLEGRQFDVRAGTEVSLTLTGVTIGDHLRRVSQTEEDHHFLKRSITKARKTAVAMLEIVGKIERARP